MVQVGSRWAVLETKLVFLQLVLFYVLWDSPYQISADLWILHQVMQREDGIRNHIWVFMKAVHPAVVGFRWVLLIEDVREVPLSSSNLNLMGHEALVKAHAHVAFKEAVTPVGERYIGRDETQCHTEFNIQAVFDLCLWKALQGGQAGPEGSDSPHLTTELDLTQNSNRMHYNITIILHQKCFPQPTYCSIKPLCIQQVSLTWCI